MAGWPEPERDRLPASGCSGIGSAANAKALACLRRRLPTGPGSPVPTLAPWRRANAIRALRRWRDWPRRSKSMPVTSSVASKTSLAGPSRAANAAEPEETLSGREVLAGPSPSDSVVGSHREHRDHRWEFGFRQGPRIFSEACPAANAREYLRGSGDGRGSRWELDGPGR